MLEIMKGENMVSQEEIKKKLEEADASVEVK